MKLGSKALPKLFRSASVAALLLLKYHTAGAQAARDVAQQTFPSVVLLVLEDAGGRPLALGSGFLVADEVIASNLHVVNGASSGYAKIVGKNEKYVITGMLGSDQTNDLVLIRAPGLKGPSLVLADTNSVSAAGDEVYAVGNPRGLEGTFSAGIVSSVRNLESQTLLQITAPISPGSSGGPVLNKEGKVVAVAVATFKDGQNLNFAIPSFYLSALLGRQGPVAKFTGQQMKSFRPAWQDLGSRNTAGVVATGIRWDLIALVSFSLQNKLQEDVRNVRGLVVITDKSGEPLDTLPLTLNETIPAGLARRVEGLQVSKTVGTIVWDANNHSYNGADKQVEVRILDFEFVK